MENAGERWSTKCEITGGLYVEGVEKRQVGVRRKILVALAAAVAYGAASWLTNIFPLQAAENVEIRLGVAIPIFFGLIHGPWVGFVTGALGNFIGDWATGYLQYPPDQSTGVWALDVVKGYVLHWQVGNGLMGLIPGLLAAKYRRYWSGRDHIVALSVTVMGIVVGMGFASFAGMYLDGTTFAFAFSHVFVPAVQVNLIAAVVLVPIVLFNHARLDLRQAYWSRSGLLQRLALTILVSAGLPILLLGLLVTQQTAGTPAGPTEVTVKLVLTILLTLGFTVVNAALMAQSISTPLLRLTETARRMEAGELTSHEAAQLRDAQGDDEISRLSSVFGQMAHEVMLREESLRKQVRSLQIEIDRVKQNEQVAQITESDFFQGLAEKAQEMRNRRRATEVSE